MTGTWVKGWVGTTDSDSSMVHWKQQTLSGNRYFDAGEYAKALSYYQQALWLARQQFSSGTMQTRQWLPWWWLITIWRIC